MAFLNQAKTTEKLNTAYAKLESLLQLYGVSQILSFDGAANAATENLRHQRLRIGTMDLKIAGIVLSQKCNSVDP